MTKSFTVPIASEKQIDQALDAGKNDLIIVLSPAIPTLDCIEFETILSGRSAVCSAMVVNAECNIVRVRKQDLWRLGVIATGEAYCARAEWLMSGGAFLETLVLNAEQDPLRSTIRPGYAHQVATMPDGRKFQITALEKR